MPGYNYRYLDPYRDQIIIDDQTGAPIGIRTDQDREMINGVSDQISGMGGGLTAISNRQITIPAGSQSIVAGGTTISGNASITCGGEFVALSY